MKEYRQVPAAVEWVGYSKARVRASLQTVSCAPSDPRLSNSRLSNSRLSNPRLSNPSQHTEVVLLWSIEEVGSIRQSVPVFTHLSHTTETSRIKCERHIFYCLFVRSLKSLIIFDHVLGWVYETLQHKSWKQNSTKQQLYCRI